MRYFFYLFFLIICVSFPVMAQDSIIPIPGQTTLSEQLCEFRKLFCGDAATVIIGTVIFVMGLLMFSGRISWTFVLLISTFIIVFISAEKFREYITGPVRIGDGDDAATYRCSCSNTLIEIIDESS